MTLFTRFLLAGAALSVLVPAAHAADYDPPLFIEEAPEYVPVEVGSGWYLRGDISYNIDHSFENLGFGQPFVTSPVYDESHTALSATIGMGYHLNDYFRIEGNIGFLSKNDQNFSWSTVDGLNNITSTASSTAENEAWSGMVNAFVDLGTYVGITPYLGGGIGLVYSQRDYRFSEDFVDPTIADLSTIDERNQVSFAYTLNAGIAYRMTQNLSLDLGYQYFAAPDLEYSVITGPATYENREGVEFHQIKAGLRYDLW